MLVRPLCPPGSAGAWPGSPLACSPPKPHSPRRETLLQPLMLVPRMEVDLSAGGAGRGLDRQLVAGALRSVGGNGDAPSAGTTAALSPGGPPAPLQLHFKRGRLQDSLTCVSFSQFFTAAFQHYIFIAFTSQIDVACLEAGNTGRQSCSGGSSVINRPSFYYSLFWLCPNHYYYSCYYLQVFTLPAMWLSQMFC